MVRMSRLPPGARVKADSAKPKPKRKRRPVAKGDYLCWTCGEWFYGVTFASMERHLDAEHDGHGRVEMFAGRADGSAV